MSRERITGVWAGPDWTLRKYAWRSPCVKSPLTGQNVRAVVALDDRGSYHPGLRNADSRDSGKEFRTVYQDFTGYWDRDRAIGEAKKMLSDTMESHAQTRNHLMETPGSRECVWNGESIRIPQGDLQGIVCRIGNGQYIAGAQIYSMDNTKNWEQGPDTRWLSKPYTSQEKAIGASERFVGKIAPRIIKRAESPEKRRTLALLDRATTPRADSGKRSSPARDNSRSIDR
jgi:hypothetical protein